MYDYLSLVKNKLYNKSLSSFLYHLFLASLIYGCGTKNISNIGGQDRQIDLPHHSNGPINSSRESYDVVVHLLHSQLETGNVDYFNELLANFSENESSVLIDTVRKQNAQGDTLLHHAVKWSQAIVMIIIHKLFSIETLHPTIDEILNIKNNDRLTFIDLITLNGNIDLIKKIFEQSEQYRYTIQTYILQSSINFAEYNISSNKHIKNIENIKAVIQAINDYIKKHTNENNNLQEKSGLDDLRWNVGSKRGSNELSNIAKKRQRTEEIEEKEFECKWEICNAIFYNKEDFYKHVKEQHLANNSQNICNWEGCGKIFRFKHNLKPHTRLHTGEKPYKCQYCGKGFIQKNNHQTHERLHTGEKPYTCQYCGQKFAFESNRKTHERLHTGEKPYKCQYCSREFSALSGLKLHTRLHTGEKPYKCQYCGEGFIQKNNCTKHERAQHPLLNLDNLDIDM